MIPVRHDDQLLSDNKIALYGDYYANIIVYNFVEDTISHSLRRHVYSVILSVHESDDSASIPIRGHERLALYAGQEH